MTYGGAVRILHRMTTQEFEHIARMLRPRLIGIGRDFFGHGMEAEDVAQEVLMRLWVMRERLDTRLGLDGLAVRMADNRQMLAEALQKLSPTERRLFKMRQELEMDLPQMASITGIGERSLSSMLSAARRKVMAHIMKQSR